MTNETKIKPPAWFWAVSVLALIWNIMGAIAYLGNVYMTDEAKAEMTTDQISLMEATPAWATAAFAIAVWGGLLGCIALILRKKWARPVLMISLLGILVQMAHWFLMTNGTELYSQMQGVIIPLLVIVIGIALVYLARVAHNRGWIS